VIFLFDSIPLPYRDWMWWNPLIHPIGLVRKGIYSTYDATYVSSVFVMAVSGITLALGLLLLRRYHRDIINF
jgi:capsular polysaccharide transport system permease protein